jgi:hypothetical protein
MMAGNSLYGINEFTGNPIALHGQAAPSKADGREPLATGELHPQDRRAGQPQLLLRYLLRQVIRPIHQDSDSCPCRPRSDIALPSHLCHRGGKSCTAWGWEHALSVSQFLHLHLSFVVPANALFTLQYILELLSNCISSPMSKRCLKLPNSSLTRSLTASSSSSIGPCCRSAQCLQRRFHRES